MMTGQVGELVAQVPPGYLAAVGGRPGAMTVELMYQLAESLGSLRRGAVLLYGESWQRHPRGLLGFDYGTRPGWLGAKDLIPQRQETLSTGGVLIDTVPFEQRCLSRRFDPWHFLGAAAAWCRLTGGNVLLHTMLSRKVEDRVGGFVPHWRDLPRPLSQFSDHAILVVRPAFYYPGEWPAGLHQVRAICRESRQTNQLPALLLGAVTG